MNPSHQPDYSTYSLPDFVLDESFRRWVLLPDEEIMSFWHSYMLRHPEQQTVINEASAILLHLRVRYDDLTNASRERIWQVLDTAYEQQERSTSTESIRPFRQRFFGSPLRSWQVAASLAGLLLLAAGGWVWSRYGSQQEVHTQYGEQLTVTLPDGSSVRLNGNSILMYSGKWEAEDNREVWLEGEAFFNVTKKMTTTGRLKFVTHTPNLDISVLGTQFNVNTRRGNTLVVLAEGKVQLSKPNDQNASVVLMKPGDLATAQAGIEQVAIRQAKPQLHTAWTKNQFAFENTSLREIAQQLNDTWGVNLIFEDSALAERRFTGNLSSQDLETLITTLATTFDVEADRKGSQIYLRHP
ncbi:FecR domain-containing protein [Spirosoma sp. BT702]|uniref:FecR domain-containing protein n=1 Tax=Spirosoma profusum TaxID=2771354 RepID=A0A927ATA3_9BACT|nr:FecR domain-containing protein [Spirosoma profusum]MBD2703005.1 FecR domain-containing protein [Spirosoma profusum]